MSILATDFAYILTSITILDQHGLINLALGKFTVSTITTPCFWHLANRLLPRYLMEKFLIVKILLTWMTSNVKAFGARYKVRVSTLRMNSMSAVLNKIGAILRR